MNKARSGSRPPSDKGSFSSPRDPALWRHPEPAGYVIGFTSFATIAAPLLAGFSLTTIVALSGSTDNRGTRGDIAIAAFSVAAVLMLFTLQAGIAASQRAIPPDQRAAQYPEARRQLGWMRKLLLDQWRDEKLCRWTYNLGVIAFLGGLIAVLIPSPGKWDDPHTARVFPIVALAVVVIAILIEIVLTIRMPGFVSSRLVPGSEASPVKLKEVKDDPDLINIGEQDLIKLAEKLVEAQLLAFGDNGSLSGDSSNAGAAATAFVAVKSALDSVATRLAALNEAVSNSVTATIRQAEAAEAQLALAHQDSERRSLAAAAMRRANVEVTGPYEQETGMTFGQSSIPTEERWKVLNRGPAVARGVRLELPQTTAEWLNQDVHLLAWKAGPPPEELGDLQVGKARAVRVSKVGKGIYPVNIVLSWTDDEGLHEEHRSIGYTQLPWL
jgi:hypothetical protein